MKKSISVVIPCKNDGALLAEALESLAKQTVKADEIIVVNNASADDTKTIGEKFGAQVVNEDRIGVLRATATGFDLAKSDIILRLDADVVLKPDFIERVHQIWTNAAESSGKKVVGVTGSARFMLPGRKADLYSRLYLGAYRAAVRSTLGHQPLFGTNFSIPRCWWEQVRESIDFNNSLVHDDMHLSFAVRPDETVWLQKDLTLDTDPRPLHGIRQFINRFRRGFYTIFLNWKNSPPHRRLAERRSR
ncbi:glycosyl transferase family A [Corynebacterium stationis]|uniref:glycosyltransferase family 2 protein n=1 Tax=Corynebacterium stationis TaxID=1705 RepID=UPI0009505AA5|nr:glycosyltransferase family A protein [Corynebacterium stationis]APT95707.1 glycosyl transferase family A [Corynebacterium stationis]